MPEQQTSDYWREREREAQRRARLTRNPVARAYWRWRADSFLARQAACEAYVARA